MIRDFTLHSHSSSNQILVHDSDTVSIQRMQISTHIYKTPCHQQRGVWVCVKLSLLCSSAAIVTKEINTAEIKLCVVQKTNDSVMTVNCDLKLCSAGSESKQCETKILN